MISIDEPASLLGKGRILFIRYSHLLIFPFGDAGRAAEFNRVGGVFIERIISADFIPLGDRFWRSGIHRRLREGQPGDWTQGVQEFVAAVIVH